MTRWRDPGFITVIGAAVAASVLVNLVVLGRWAFGEVALALAFTAVLAATTLTLLVLRDRTLSGPKS